MEGRETNRRSGWFQPQAARLPTTPFQLRCPEMRMQVDSKIATPEGEETILPLLACLIARKNEYGRPQIDQSAFAARLSLRGQKFRDV